MDGSDAQIHLTGDFAERVTVVPKCADSLQRHDLSGSAARYGASFHRLCPGIWKRDWMVELAGFWPHFSRME